MTDISLRPSYWASVSGGKDSLFMLYLILKNPDKYKLDGVVHFELEIDYPFVKSVIDYMQKEVEKLGIPFLRLKPLHTWEELYYKKLPNGNIRGFPTRKARWCNSNYKLSARSSLLSIMKQKGFDVIFYIGYCADEVKRYAHRSFGFYKEIYPLVSENVLEADIWTWAKKQPIFNDYYLYNKRLGCMYCPMASRMAIAYLSMYYPSNYCYMIEKMRETEKIRESELGVPFSILSGNPYYNTDYLVNNIEEVWLPKLRKMHTYQPISIFDIYEQ